MCCQYGPFIYKDPGQSFRVDILHAKSMQGQMYDPMEMHFKSYEKSGHTKKGLQSCGSTADKVCYSKKRNRAKKRTHKQQHEISKPNNFGGNVALNRWRYLGGYMLMSIGMLALCWMILTTLEVWTEPATSNLTMRSFGTKLSAIYKCYTDTWSEDGRSCRRC